MTDRPPLKWKIGTFMRQRYGGNMRQPEDGLVSDDGNFGIYRDPNNRDSERIVLVSLASGFSLNTFRYMKEAKAAAERARDALPWQSIKSRDDLKAYPKDQVKGAIQLLGRSVA